jgi:hypothetical protein
MMRNFSKMLCGWSLLSLVVISGCASPDGIHRLAASMGTRVETYRLPDDFVMPPFPEIEVDLSGAELINEEMSSDPFPR